MSHCVATTYFRPLAAIPDDSTDGSGVEFVAGGGLPA